MRHLHNCQTILDTAEALIDICIECKEKFIYKKCRHSGRIDNERYLKDHKRDFLQKGTKLYEKYWPEKKREKVERPEIITEPEKPRRRMSKQGVIRETLY
jgi:hypothetical protein